MSLAAQPQRLAQPKLTEQELTNIFRSRQAELQALVNAGPAPAARGDVELMHGHPQKVGELEREAEEHVLVIETLKDASLTEPTRKAFRLVGGILVERTVGDVLPELQSRHEQMKSIMETLMKEYKKKESDFGEWQRANNIVVKQR